LFIEAALEPLEQQRYTKMPYEGQDLIEARLARSPLVWLPSIPLVLKSYVRVYNIMCT